ncbi:hypothetical protein DB30_08026 [Enhygromyxa salina]|uniref:Uncharacterized protein n=1 Tax=Enhygromyxa salina TaxID=215803 RepID=A0A0C1Z799_9BACT|nr:hypothetical protein DB30_08026 [Enhygromyxa salina]
MWDVESGTTQLVMAALDGNHATYIPGPHSTGGRIIEASAGAWRWLRWKVDYDDGTTDLLPAETFGELPAPHT